MTSPGVLVPKRRGRRKKEKNKEDTNTLSKMVDISDLVAQGKSNRLRSVVWNDFHKIRKNGKELAVCNNCNKEFVGKASSGTTHLKKHLLRCTKKPIYDSGQELVGLSDRMNSEAPATTPKPLKVLSRENFEQERSQSDFARMIILHEYPFSIVEHIGFRKFVNNLQPQFKVPSPNTIKAGCLAIFQQEKDKLYVVLDKVSGRLSLAATMWSSCQNIGFLCLTAQYIDEAWSLQKKILNFVMVESPYTGDALSETIMKCLIDWNIYHKLFTLTTENSSMNDTVTSRIKDLLKKKKMLVNYGQLLHVQCIADVISLILQDGLELIKEVIHKIREGVKHVKSSPATEQKFTQVANHVQVRSQRSLSLDVPAQWNSTYLMLDIALEYKEAFSYLQKRDSAYSMTPNDGEWEVASLVCNHLKSLFEVANDCFCAEHPTSNLYFPAICAMKLRLDEWSQSINTIVCSMALKMTETLDKYWKACNKVLALAAILDPRFKMKLVEYYFHRMYGNNSTNHIKEVYDAATNLLHEYAGNQASSIPYQECSGRVGSDRGGRLNGKLLLESVTVLDDKLRGFDEFINATSQTEYPKSDLDLYLEEGVTPRNQEFNILTWWKVNAPKYPVLSRVARDILGIPVSTVPFESIFKTRGMVLDAYKSSLDADTLQALICAQDWLLDDFGVSSTGKWSVAIANHDEKQHSTW